MVRNNHLILRKIKGWLWPGGLRKEWDGLPHGEQLKMQVMDLSGHSHYTEHAHNSYERLYAVGWIKSCRRMTNVRKQLFERH